MSESRRTQLDPWSTSTGPNAICTVCRWGIHGDTSDPKDARRVMSAARFHVRDSGHSVYIERGQVAVMTRV